MIVADPRHHHQPLSVLLAGIPGSRGTSRTWLERRPLVRRSSAGARRPATKSRLDTYVGMAFSNLVALAIIITTAATLHTAGITNIETSARPRKH